MKRNAEEAAENKASAKKLKVEVHEAAQIEKNGKKSKATFLAQPKKKHETSSSEDDSSSEEEVCSTETIMV